MKCTLIGSRHFGAAVLQNLLDDGIEVVRVVTTSAEDRLAIAAQSAGLPLTIQENPRKVAGYELQEDTDIIIAAHTHAFVLPEALARAKIGAFGYHPSLLPRHRGIAAVEWTILEGDPIAGGSIYHLDAGWDDGAIAAQDWCFVQRGETARELWERALSPLGLNLIRQVVAHAKAHGTLPSKPQDVRFATKAPLIKRNVALSSETQPLTTAVVATVVGPERQGLLRQISECTQHVPVNWADSRITHLAGQFAGIVHFQVAPEHADALMEALRSLESSGLQVLITRNDAPRIRADQRMVRLNMQCPDRPGVVRMLTRTLAERNVSIADMHTEILAPHGDVQQHVFSIQALLVVPQALDDEALRPLLEGLAAELSADINLDHQALDATRAGP